MTHFARELLDLLSDSQLRAADLARKSKLPKGHLSRLLHGLVACNRRTLDRVLGALPRHSHARLVQAYLRDVVSPSALTALSRSAASPSPAQLSPAARRAFEFLLAHPQIKEIDRLLVHLAATLGDKNCNRPSATKTATRK